MINDIFSSQIQMLIKIIIRIIILFLKICFFYIKLLIIFNFFAFNVYYNLLIQLIKMHIIYPNFLLIKSIII